jgi:hypothetical protein
VWPRLVRYHLAPATTQTITNKQIFISRFGSTLDCVTRYICVDYLYNAAELQSLEDLYNRALRWRIVEQKLSVCVLHTGRNIYFV